MRGTSGSRAWGRAARIGVLVAGALVLAGCATGYSFVQPNAADSGGYYTSEEPYSGQGYYDYYGTGPYYPGTGDYGYYNGTWPHSGAYGYFGSGYYGYAPQWSLDVGISNVWNFPGYWGPWYSTGFPLGGCYSWRCGDRHRRHDRDDHHGSHSWRHEDPTSGTADIAGPAPGHVFAERAARARAITAWEHDHFVRSPRWRATSGRFAGIPAPRARMGDAAVGPAYPAGFRADPIAAPAAMPAPAGFSRAPRPTPMAIDAHPTAGRPASAPPAHSSTQRDTTPGIRIR